MLRFSCGIRSWLHRLVPLLLPGVIRSSSGREVTSSGLRLTCGVFLRLCRGVGGASLAFHHTATTLPLVAAFSFPEKGWAPGWAGVLSVMRQDVADGRW